MPIENPHFKPLVLIVLDGVGIAPTSAGNAVTKASTPFLEQVWDSHPHTMLYASGAHVGLPNAIKGNSEVGHMNMGSGRVVFQDLPRINRAIDRGAFANNQIILDAFSRAEKNKTTLHTAVCFSDAGVHGTINHLEALLALAQKIQFTRPLVIHAFTDGRDSPPRSAATFLTIIQDTIDETGMGIIGSIMGRYYAMDRNRVWDRVEKAYIALTEGSPHICGSWKQAIDEAYQRGENDEFINPTTISSEKFSDPCIKDGDSFIFLNYRSDRSIELTSAFILPEFNLFPRKVYLENLHFVGMTQYAKAIPRNVAFPADDITMTLGRVLAENDQRQLRIAESEKFPHVTYFFNGGRSIKFQGEDRIEIASPNVPTYDLKPEMSLPLVTQTILNKISLRVYDFILINCANGDMVGHTGVFDAGIKAMITVDKAVEQIVSATQSIGGAVIITADHGNVEEMINLKTQKIDTEHSNNPVPFVFIPPRSVTNKLTLPQGALADVAPTVLSIMGINKPSEMTGKDLVS